MQFANFVSSTLISVGDRCLHKDQCLKVLGPSQLRRWLNPTECMRAACRQLGNASCPEEFSPLSCSQDEERRSSLVIHFKSHASTLFAANSRRASLLCESPLALRFGLLTIPFTTTTSTTTTLLHC